MKVCFNRSRSFELILQNPRDESRRGFYFELVAAVTAPVNPESGMTVNLTVVDEWLRQTEAELSRRQFISATEIVFAARDLLRPMWAARAEIRDFWIQLRHRQATLSLEETHDDIFVAYRWPANSPDDEGILRPCSREAEVRGPLDAVDEALGFLRTFAGETEGLAFTEAMASTVLPEGLRWRRWREERPDGHSAVVWEF
jgi:hypothetical protein